MSENYEEYVKSITPTHNLWLQMAKAFLVGGIICVIGQAVTNFGISMLQMEEQQAGSFFYYNSDFVLVANALSEEYLCNLVEGALKRGKRRMPGVELCVGLGSKCMDISSLSVSYKRAKAAAHIAITQKKQVVKFDDCGFATSIFSYNSNLFARTHLKRNIF